MSEIEEIKKTPEEIKYFRDWSIKHKTELVSIGIYLSDTKDLLSLLEKEKESHEDTINQLEEAAGKHLNNLMRISKLTERIGQLENAINEWTKLYHSLQEHADKLGGIITSQTVKRLELEERVKELEPDALYLRKYRGIRGKNPEIPCACVIDEDGQWIKKCGFHATIIEGLEEKVKELDDRIVSLVLKIDEYAGRIIKAESRLKNLTEAVEKRRDFIPDIESPTLPEDIEKADDELYKVLREK